MYDHTIKDDILKGEVEIVEDVDAETLLRATIKKVRKI